MKRLTLSDICNSRRYRENVAAELFKHAHPELEHLPHEEDVCLNYSDMLHHALERGDSIACDDRELWAAIGVDASCVPVDVAMRENTVYGLVTDIAMEDIVDDMVIRGQSLVHRTEEAYPMLRHFTVNDGVSWTKGL